MLTALFPHSLRVVGRELAGLGAMTPAVSELDVAGDTGSKLVDGGEGAPVKVIPV
jgi:hypothetical protein